MGLKTSKISIFGLFLVFFPAFLSRHSFICCDKVFSIAIEFSLLQQSLLCCNKKLGRYRVFLSRKNFSIATENLVATEFSLLR